MSWTEYILIACIYLVLAAIVNPLWQLIDKNFLSKQLLENGNRAAKSLSNITDTLAITNAFLWYSGTDGNISLDSGFYRKMNLRERPISLQTILRIVHPDDREALAQALRNITKGKLELRITFPAWQTHYISLDISELDDNGNKTPMGMVMLIDDLKKQETERHEAIQIEDDSDIKSCFLAAMGHEIKNPLNSIVGFSRLIIDHNGKISTENLQRYCDIIEQSSEEMITMLNNVILYSEQNNKELELSLSRKRVCDLMDELYTIHTTVVPKHLDFRFVKGSSGDYVMVNRSSITQVVSNLVNNAVVFTNKGYIALGWTSDDKYVTIFLEDSGQGIPLRVRDILFNKEDAHRVGPKGDGIGLSLCKRLIEKMGGSISFSSEVDKGSRFELHLPRVK